MDALTFAAKLNRMSSMCAHGTAGTEMGGVERALVPAMPFYDNAVESDGIQDATFDKGHYFSTALILELLFSFAQELRSEPDGRVLKFIYICS